METTTNQNFWKIVALLMALIGFVGYQGWRAWQRGALSLDVRWWIVGAVIVLALMTWFVSRTMYQKIINARVAAGPTILLLPGHLEKSVDPTRIELWGRIARILPLDEHCSFELSGNSSQILFSVRASAPALEHLVDQIQVEWRDAQQRPTGQQDVDPLITPPDWATYWFEIAPQFESRPIEASARDPLFTPLKRMSDVGGESKVVVQVLARLDKGTRAKLGQQAFTARSFQGEVKDRGVKTVQSKHAATIEARADHTFLQVNVRVAAFAPSPERAKSLADNMSNALRGQFSHSNPLKVIGQGSSRETVMQRQFNSWRSRAWAESELALLAHLVGEDAKSTAPLLRFASAAFLPANHSLRVPHDQRARTIKKKVTIR